MHPASVRLWRECDLSGGDIGVDCPSRPSLRRSPTCWPETVAHGDSIGNSGVIGAGDVQWMCAHEWTFRRVYCPACGEEREPQMAYYSAPEIAQVRVDVCDTCHTYLKSIDLTKLGLAVPVVDELATTGPVGARARVRKAANQPAGDLIRQISHLETGLLLTRTDPSRSPMLVTETRG